MSTGMAVGFGTLCNCRYKVRGDYFLYFDLVRCCPLGLGRGHPLRCQLLCLVAQAFSFSSSWALLISSWWSGAVGSRPTWPTWPRGAGERSELDTAAAISPASGSRPTTAEPPAPSPLPAQQGSAAVLSSSTPLCPGSVQDRHKLLRAQGGGLAGHCRLSRGEVHPLFWGPFWGPPLKVNR